MQNRASELFPPELRTASIVHRWSIVRTLERDNVANHTFYVTIYARGVAKLIEWKGDYEKLMMKALTHDLDETITGDIVSPVKAQIVDETKAGVYVGHLLRERLPGFADLIAESDPEIDAIVKVADRMDALFFLINETKLGNSIVRHRTHDAEHKLQQAWMALPCDAFYLDQLWKSVISPAITAHLNFGSRGI